eukprot:608507-Amphidinium_carterae.1
MSDGSRGVLLTLSGVDASSNVVKCPLLCWRRGNGLRWEVKRLFLGCKFEGKSSRDQVVILNRGWPKWTAPLRSRSLEDGVHFDCSQKALVFQKISGSRVDHAEQEYWVQTASLVGMLGFWCGFRKGREEKMAAKAVLRLLLEQTVGGDFIGTAVQEPELSAE